MTELVSQEGRILVLDDEPMVTETLETLLGMESRWIVEAFNTPRTALEAVSSHEYDVILSDYLMPGMDGLEFLKKVKDQRPFATRILLTGYADKQNAIRFINEVGLFHYIEKPWNNNSLMMVIRNAVERARLVTTLDEKMRELVERDQSLETLRAGLLKAML